MTAPGADCGELHGPGFAGAHESAHELAVQERRNSIYVNACLRQEFPRFFDAVDSRGLHLQRFKSRAG